MIAPKMTTRTVQIISPDAALNGSLAAVVSSIKNCLPQATISWPAANDALNQVLLVIGTIDFSNLAKCKLLVDRIQSIRKLGRFPQFILIADQGSSGNETLDMQKQLFEAGVCDIIERPVSLSRIRYWIDSLAIEQEFSNKLTKQGQLGRSKCESRLLTRIKKVSSAEINVLLTGETGVGKTWWAKQIHQNSRRAKKPFVVVNCANFTPSLAESQLFGHAKGAFTGADKRNIGQFEFACGGTIFLDEIDSLPLEVQGKLLRVVESREFVPMGDHKAIPMNARIISATNRCLDQLVQSGGFRADLFYRLNAYEVKVPPLRERIEEIETLSHFFANEYAIANCQPQKSLDSQVTDLLTRYPWPGNLRELRNCIQHGAIDSDDCIIRPENLPECIVDYFNQPQVETSAIDRYDSVTLLENLPPTIDPASFREASKLIHALETNHDNRSEAARDLGVSRTTLYNMLKRHCLI